jgi:hypothetical protein
LNWAKGYSTGAVRIPVQESHSNSGSALQDSGIGLHVRRRGRPVSDQGSGDHHCAPHLGGGLQSHAIDSLPLLPRLRSQASCWPLLPFPTWLPDISRSRNLVHPGLDRRWRRQACGDCDDLGLRRRIAKGMFCSARNRHTGMHIHTRKDLPASGLDPSTGLESEPSPAFQRVSPCIRI